MLTKKESPKNEVKNTKATKIAAPPYFAEAPSPAATKATKAEPTKASTSLSNRVKEGNLTPKKGAVHTRIIVKYDVGYKNQLYIRGKGANLTWDKGQPLKNVKGDEWTWETNENFTECEFKVLINDKEYEQGNNHCLKQGATLLYTPHFC